MHPTAAAVSADPPHRKRNLGRARISNDAGYLPKRPPSLFQQARRRRDLVDAFVSALGGEDALSAVVAMNVRRAAELLTMAEMARCDMLNGQPTDMLALVRLEGAASRAVRALGLRAETLAPQRALQRAQQRMDANTKAAKADRREKPSQRREGPPPDDDQAQADD